jgi:cation transport ATPase
MTPAAERKDRPPKTRRRSPIRLDRLRSGEAIALVAAILLFVLMFLDWFGVSLEKAPGSLILLGPGWEGGSAWQTLEVIPLFLMLAIVVAVGAAFLRVIGSEWKPAIPAAAAVCVLGLLAAVLILVRIVSPPGAGPEVEGFAYETTLKLPVFLALAAALGIAYGGWRAMGQEGTSFAAIAKRLESPSRPRPKPAADAKPSGRGKP